MLPKDNGKVIVSLLAGATAGIVAGLLLAPETGEDARKDIRESASQWGASLNKLVQNVLGKLQSQPGTSATPQGEDRSAADALLHSIHPDKKGSAAAPGDLAT